MKKLRVKKEYGNWYYQVEHDECGPIYHLYTSTKYVFSCPVYHGIRDFVKYVCEEKMTYEEADHAVGF